MEEFNKLLKGWNRIEIDLWNLLDSIFDKKDWNVEDNEIVREGIKLGCGHAFRITFSDRVGFHNIKDEVQFSIAPPINLRKFQKEYLRTGKYPKVGGIKVKSMNDFTDNKIKDVIALGRLKCSYCLKEEQIGVVTKVCSGCKLIRYCSRECQEYDWGDHKLQCKLRTGMQI